jgi:hypothetical protein
MKALSLWQPSASLIARGVKTIVTMLSATDHRGPIAIHAAKTLDLAGSPDDLCRAALGREWRSSVPLGAIVAVGHLCAVGPATDFLAGTTLAEQAAGVFSHDRWAWTLTDVRALRRPIPHAGRQGLFNWDPPEDLYERLGPVLDPIALTHEIGWGWTKHRILA